MLYVLSTFYVLLNYGFLVAEHNGYAAYDSDYSDSDHLTYDDDVYTGEHIICYN